MPYADLGGWTLMLNEKATKVKQAISFAQLIGTTIKHYRLEQLVQQQQHVAIFLARRTTAEVKPEAGTGPAPTEQIYQLRLCTLPEEITAQERLILLGQVQQQMSQIAALQHPVIQPVLEYGHEQGMMYLVTPFIPARYALANILSTQGPLDITQVGYNLELLASALEYAYKRAITHGNLTASSVFLRPSSENGKSFPYNPPTLLLTDIGIAHLQTLLKHYDEAFHHVERFPGQAINSTTDTFALGALLYQMLTAHTIFADGRQEPGKPVQIPPLNLWRRDLPAQLDSVINLALTRDTGRGEAYPRPNALVDAYYRIIPPNAHSHYNVGTPLAASASGLAPTQSQQPLTRRKLTVALAATGAVAIVAGGGWFFLQQQHGPQVAQGSAPVATSGQQTTVPEATTPPQNQPTPAATPPQQPAHNGTVIAHTADLPINHASTFTIPNSNSSNPGVLIHLPDRRFVAFDSTCTHQGCQVSYNTASKQLECPCHSAVFDPARNAVVVSGPAPTPLTPINIHVNADGTITVG